MAPKTNLTSWNTNGETDKSNPLANIYGMLPVLMNIFITAS